MSQGDPQHQAYPPQSPQPVPPQPHNLPHQPHAQPAQQQAYQQQYVQSPHQAHGQPRKPKPPRTGAFNWVSVTATIVGALSVVLNLVLYVPSLLIGMTEPDSINTLEIEWLARPAPVLMGLGVVLLIATAIFYFGSRNANNRGFVRAAFIVNISNVVMVLLIFLLTFVMFSTAMFDEFMRSLN